MAKRRNPGAHIKDYLKPNPLARTQQGYYVPINTKKYLGEKDKIIYRSSWEFLFLRWCDSSDNVIMYSNEPIGIPYFNPFKKRVGRYFIDFYVHTTDGERDKFWLIEIK